FRLDKQIAEDRVRLVCGLGGENHFRVTGYFDSARDRGKISDDNAAQFDILFGRYRQLSMDFESGATVTELRFTLSENGLVILHRQKRGLKGTGPEFVRGDITQIEEHAEAIARCIFAPSRHRQIAPPAITATGMTDRDMIIAIGEQMNFRCARVRICKNANATLALSIAGPRAI